MKRKLVNLILSTVFNMTLLFAATPLVAQADTISSTFTVGVNVYSSNGVDYTMDAAPYISAGRTFVPVRYLANSLGAKISWDARTQIITITQGSNVVILTIGSTTETVNGTAHTMDVAPVVVNGRTMLPARWVAEALGYQVAWNPVEQMVLINVAQQNIPKLSYDSSVQGTYKHYSWKYNNINYSWDIEVPNDLLKYDSEIYNLVNTYYNSNGDTQQQIMRTSSSEIATLISEDSKDLYGNYSAWVDDQTNNSYIQNIATWLSKQAHLDGCDYFHTAEFVQGFVGGALPYVKTVAPQLAAQTLVFSGDCKSKSILLASILKDMGYKVALLRFSPINSSDGAHEAVGIYLNNSQITTLRSMYRYTYSNGVPYYYVESTYPGWHIGDDPHSGKGPYPMNFDSAYIYPLN